jgi:hypothetical protein
MKVDRSKVRAEQDERFLYAHEILKQCFGPDPMFESMVYSIVTQFAIRFCTWYEFGYAVHNPQRIRYARVYIVGTLFGFVLRSKNK